MNQADQIPFFQLLDDTCDSIFMGNVLSAGAKAIMFEDLERFSFEVVKAALKAHRRDPQRGKHQPSTLHIEHQIKLAFGQQWIPADEAFARLDFDESLPLILNQVTAQAYAVAAPFMQTARPDRTAARMAFKGAYERLVQREEQAGKLPRHWVSPGGTPEQQAEIREEGIRMGLLNSTWAPPVAPALGYNAPPPEAIQALSDFKLKKIPLGNPNGDDDD